MGRWRQIRSTNRASSSERERSESFAGGAMPKPKRTGPRRGKPKYRNYPGFCPGYSASAASMTSQMAHYNHRRYCRNPELQLPSSEGKLRQAQPVRVIHKTASNTRRWSTGRHPPRERFSVRNGAKNTHSSSVKSPRANAALRKDQR